MFKNRLQEYTQKASLPSPLYGFIKDGAPHQPRFKATVSVNGVSYESAPGHTNLKSAEQAAAKVALEHLQGGSGVTSAPVFESGLYKSLLQEHLQKAKLPLPVYVLLETDKGLFTATVEIGGVKYRGPVARSRKEAKIQAARAAVLAIQSIAGKFPPFFSPVTRNRKEAEILAARAAVFAIQRISASSGEAGAYYGMD